MFEALVITIMTSGPWRPMDLARSSALLILTEYTKLSLKQSQEVAQRRLTRLHPKNPKRSAYQGLQLISKGGSSR